MMIANINTNMLFTIICGVSALVILYALLMLFGSDTGSKRKSKKIKGPTGPDAVDSDEQRSQKLQEQVHYLQNDLEKARTEYADSLREVDIVKQREEDLKKELARREQWVGKDEESLNKLKERNFELEGKFKTKQKELEDEFAKNINLTKNLREASQKLEIVEHENKRMADVVESQKHQIEKYIQEAQQHMEAIAQFKKQQENSEWVPKVEFNKLNEEYTELEKALEAREEKVRKFGEEIVRLKNQLASQHQAAAPQQTEVKEPAQEKPKEDAPPQEDSAQQ